MLWILRMILRDEMLANVSKDKSWWDIEDSPTDNKVIVDVSKVVTESKITNQDDHSLPTVNTHSTTSIGKADNKLSAAAQALLISPAPLHNPIADTATVSSGLTLDTVANRMDVMEGSVATVQSNMAEVHNTLNQTNHMVRQLVAHLNLNKDAVRSTDANGNKS